MIVLLIIIIIILPNFCDRDFSETAQSILMTFGRVMGNYMNLIHFFAFLKFYFRSGDIVEFRFLKTNFVRE